MILARLVVKSGFAAFAVANEKIYSKQSHRARFVLASFHASKNSRKAFGDTAVSIGCLFNYMVGKSVEIPIL